MKNTVLKSISVILLFVFLFTVFTACRGKGTVSDFAQTAQTVLINGKEATTVESRMGAFEGKQGDTVEFIFEEPKTINAVYIIEKTASVKQFNVYAEIDGEYKLIYTGKEIVAEYCTFEEVTATAVKIQIVNTDIGKDTFILQGISIYFLLNQSNTEA